MKKLVAKKPDAEAIEARKAQYRKQYPKSTLYFTEDGNCFLQKNPCVDYAKKTKQKWVEDKPEVVEEETVELTKEEAEEKLLKMELNDETDYDEARELVKVLELETESKSKDDALIALEDYKEKLNATE